MSDLYDRDFLRWTEDQAAALRRANTDGANLPIDWENLAEEIESLGKSQRRELASQIRRILRHLLKLEASPATGPRAGWRATVIDARAEIVGILRDSPSLRREIDRLVTEESGAASKLAAADLEEHGELTGAARARLEETEFAADQVLGEWLPAAPP
jgi:hypothetical protein